MRTLITGISHSNRLSMRVQFKRSIKLMCRFENHKENQEWPKLNFRMQTTVLAALGR